MASLGAAWRGEAWPGAAGQAPAWQARLGIARHARQSTLGVAWRGQAWQGAARYGSHGKARPGQAGFGTTRHGRLGMARQDLARQGMAGADRRGTVWHGGARQGFGFTEYDNARSREWRANVLNAACQRCVRITLFPNQGVELIRLACADFVTQRRITEMAIWIQVFLLNKHSMLDARKAKSAEHFHLATNLAAMAY